MWSNSVYPRNKNHGILWVGFPGGASGEDPPASVGDVRDLGVWSLSWEDSLEEGMVTHSSILAWRTPWTEESGGLQSMGS